MVDIRVAEEDRIGGALQFAPGTSGSAPIGDAPVVRKSFPESWIWHTIARFVMACKRA